MTEPPTDDWPTRDGDTAVIARDHETLVTAPPPPPGAPPPDRRIGAGMLLGLGAVLLVVAGGAIAWFLTHRDTKTQVTTVVVRSAPTPASATQVAVPRVVGTKEQEALVRLAEVGLRPKEVYRPTARATGVVVSQKPREATSARKGSRVTIVIDSGAPKVAVPDVGGSSLADAQAALDKLGLDSTVTQVTSTQPAGSIVDMAPKPGTKLDKGSVVTLSVARQGQTQTTTQTATTTTAPAPAQPTTATVPDVGGQKEAAAADALVQAGIVPSLVFVPGADPLGTVEAQARSAGSTVPYHAHVQINLSRGPGDGPTATVPRVLGQTLAQAVCTLNGAHLRLIYVRYPVTSRSQAGKIVQQSPLGGTAPQNAQILVLVGALR